MKTPRFRLAHLVAPAALLAAPATAQSAVEVLRQGNNVLGVGNINNIESSAINDYGEWLVLTDTGNPNEDIDFALVRNGFLTLQEGNLLVGPPGAWLDEFATTVTINNAGATAWALQTLKPGPTPSAGPQTGQGVYFNTKPVFLQFEDVNLPAYAPNSRWFGFNLGSVHINDLNQLLIACDVDDPSIPGAQDSALVLARVDATGNLIEARDIIHETGAAPAFPTLNIDKVSSDYQCLAMNNVGDIMYQAKRVLPSNGNDRGRVIYLNETPLVVEGGLSPVDGLLYESLVNEQIGINDRREYAFTATLTGPNNRSRCLIKNNTTLIARQRSPIAAIPNLLIDNFGTSSVVKVPNTGDVVWFGGWNGPGPTDSGICINEEIVVREGTTYHNELLVQILNSSTALYDVSPNGRYIIYRATLEDGSTSAAVVDLGRVTPMPDCGNNHATLKRARGFAVAGSTVTFGLDKAQGLGVTPFLLLSDALIDPDSPCGFPLPYGDLLIDFGNGNPFLTLIGTPWGGNPVEISLHIANNPLLVNLKVYAQGIFFDVGDQVPAPPFSMTNALELEIGAP